MPLPNPHSRRIPALPWLVRLALSGVGLLALTGCGEEAVRHYEADRVRQPERTRLVAVLVPRDAQTWFFKLEGLEDAVEVHLDEFNDFLKTVHFNADPPVVWKLPEGWQEERGGSALRYATLHFGSKDRPLEVTVTMLGREASDLGPNVNRWRRQIGLGPLAETELPSVTQSVKIDGVDAEEVDLVGPGTQQPAAAAHPPVADDAGPPIHFNAPPSWREIHDPNALAAFEIADGDQTAKATVTPLEGNGGGVLANVNLWRDQIGLGPIDENRLTDVPTLTVDGTASPYVDLASPAGPPRRMLGAIASRPGVTWFFKLTGPAELVGKQKTDFETFVKSVRFEEGKGAPP